MTAGKRVVYVDTERRNYVTVICHFMYIDAVVTRRRSELHISAKRIVYRFYIALGRELCCMREMGGTHTVEDWTECAQTHTRTDRQTDRQTKVKTVLFWTG